MAIFTDTFPAPALNSSRWTASLQGSVSLVVGSPVDGVYPVDVNNLLDEVAVHSRTKIYVPANQSFESQIDYIDPYDDVAPPVVRVIYFGWRSILEGGGNPLWGIDVMLRAFSGPAYNFQKRVITSGVSVVTNLGPDPTSGADGKFRIIRTGTSYELSYYNGGWVVLNTVVLPYTGLGYIKFGAYTESPPVPEAEFSWILEP